MGVVLALLAAGAYGAADFFGGVATRRSPVFAVTVISQLAGLLFLLTFLPFVPGHVSARALEYGAAAGVCGGVGIALLYHALSIGKMGVVSPITAVLAAAFPVVAGVLHGEHLRNWQLAGIGIALLAVVLISMTSEPADNAAGRVLEFSTKGVREAIASGVILGGFLILLARSGTAAGLYPLVSARLASTVVLVALASIARASIKPAAGALPWLAGIGVLDMAANALYVAATYAGFLSIAAVLTSLYPASTVFLARILLGERLSALQKAGVVLALAGVALISV
ncbi:MAG TPA: DMT family transporter [Candidatus Baltobacteraceae bacterium]|nr:DMT family transporter [Candidatus Baltobacteraceae bacterium]